MSTTAFLGLRSLEDFTVTGQRPESWRQKILELYPNGDSPLTALTALMETEPAGEAKYHWYERTLAPRRAAGTAGAFVYEDEALSNAYDASDDYAAGSYVHVKVTASEVKEFREGHVVLLRDADDASNDVAAVVTATLVNGSSSRVTCKLIQADGTGNGDLSNCDTMLIIGNANSEGSDVPDSITYDPTERYNYTQIFRNPHEMTRTSMQSGSTLRTGDPYKDGKKQALEMHGRDKEYAYIFGRRYTDNGPNGKIRRFTGGIIEYIKTYAASNSMDYVTDPDFNGLTWEQGGFDWLNQALEVVYRYGSEDMKIGYCGSGALLGIQQACFENADMKLEPGATKFGIKVINWITPFGTLMLKRHPLFSHEPTNRNSILIVEPRNLKVRPLQDVIYKKDTKWREGGFTSIDGMKEEYLSEDGLEINFPETFAYLNGVGLDS